MIYNVFSFIGRKKKKPKLGERAPLFPPSSITTVACSPPDVSLERQGSEIAFFILFAPSHSVAISLPLPFTFKRKNTFCTTKFAQVWEALLLWLARCVGVFVEHAKKANELSKWRKNASLMVVETPGFFIDFSILLFTSSAQHGTPRKRKKSFPILAIRGRQKRGCEK